MAQSPRSDEPIREFAAANRALCDVRFAFAESKISEVLRTIATYSQLYDIFRSALNGYNGAAELNRSITKVGGRSKLVLPQNQSKFIAYVFYLLMQFDSGRMSLRDFLDEYFYHTNPDEQYALFVKTLIVPFGDITEYIFYNGDDFNEDEVDFDLRDTVKLILQEATAAVNASPLNVEKKQELFSFARAIESALTPNRIDLVKPLFLGYRYAVGSSAVADKLSVHLDKLVQALAAADIL